MSKKENDHRVRVTNMLIRRAFMELLKQKPLQSISVKELCEKAEINRGTFYAHYTDVYDLLKKVEDDMLADFVAALEPLLSEDDGEVTLLKMTAGVFCCLKENADLCTVTLGPYGDKNFAARLIDMGRERCIEKYTAYFSHADRKQIEYFYAFVSSGCIGLLEKWLEEGMATGTEEIAGIAEGIMMHGIEFLKLAEKKPEK